MYEINKYEKKDDKKEGEDQVAKKEDDTYTETFDIPIDPDEDYFMNLRVKKLITYQVRKIGKNEDWY